MEKPSCLHSFSIPSDRAVMTEPGKLAVPVGPGDHLLGSPSAVATIVWYGDYECPYCRDAWPVIRSIAAARTNVRVAFRHFPARVNGDAMAAALAAEAADAQGRFWEMHDLLFANTQRLDETGLTHLALRAGVEIYRFAADFSVERYMPKIRRDLDGGVRSGVVRTPAFFLGGIIVPDGVPPETLTARAAGPPPPAARYPPCNDMPHRLDQW